MNALARACLDLGRWRRAGEELVDDPAASLPERVRQSSLGRPWNGLAVWVQDGPTEDLYIPAMRKHCVLIRRGPPTRLAQFQGDEWVETVWRPGEAVLVPAGTPSFWRSESARDNLHIDLCPTWLARAAGGDEPRLKSCHGRADPLLGSFGNLLLDSLQSNASLNPAFADAIALTLAIHLAEHYSDPAQGARRTAALSRRQYDAVIAAIDGDLAVPWSLERLAALVNLSPFHFARAFKAASGETPHRVVLRLRLEHARRLVLQTDAALIDVAVETGFSSLSHFGQAYRRHWGCTPGEMRRCR